MAPLPVPFGMEGMKAKGEKKCVRTNGAGDATKCALERAAVWKTLQQHDRQPACQGEQGISELDQKPLHTCVRESAANSLWLSSWRAALTRWESYTHEWENTLESSTLKKKKLEWKYAKGAFTLNHSIALEVNQCSVRTVCSGYSRIIPNKRTGVFFKASSIQLTETSGEKDLGRILSQNVLEKACICTYIQQMDSVLSLSLSRVSLLRHQGYRNELLAHSECCVKMLNVFHTYCSDLRASQYFSYCISLCGEISYRPYCRHCFSFLVFMTSCRFDPAEAL